MVVSRFFLAPSFVSWEFVPGQTEARPVPDRRKGVCSPLPRKSLAEVLGRELPLGLYTIRAEVTQN